MELREAFEVAIENAKQLPHQDNEKLLELYSLFKQSTEGDVSGERPSMFDFRGAAKFDAWESRKGMTRDEAMQAYIDLVDRLAGE